MGNVLPRLFQARSNTLPPTNTQHSPRSMKLLAKTLRRGMKSRPCRVSTTAQVASGRETSAVHRANTSGTRRTQKNGRRSRGVVRVKVVLTRAEAALLLSLTKHGDRTPAEVVREFKRMQQLVTRANACATAAAAMAKMAWRPVLESIPEELA